LKQKTQIYPQIRIIMALAVSIHIFEKFNALETQPIQTNK